MGGHAACRRFVEADSELSEYFTSGLGVRAQSYEPRCTGGAFDGDVAMLERGHQRALARYGAIEQTFARVPPAAKAVLRAVYAHGAGALDDGAREVDGITEGDDKKSDPLGLLKLALVPTWGRGSFVRLAATEDRALRAFAKRYPGRSSEFGAVLDFLAGEAGKGKESGGFFAKIVDDCEARRREALEAYEALRVERKRVEGVEKKKAREAREARLEAELGKMRRRESERFWRSLRRAS